jgi:asparagine synthase (glutamine-hydrolysing)
MPLTQWLGGALKPKMEHALGIDGLDRRGLFRKGALQRVLHQHRTGRSNHAGRLWALTVLELWFAKYAPEFEL